MVEKTFREKDKIMDIPWKYKLLKRRKTKKIKTKSG
jgi:hypothetical protein